MPDPNGNSLGYWHLHLPFSQEYIASIKTQNWIRRKVIQLLIDRVNVLIQLKTKDQSDFRIYSVIYLPNLFDSQLVLIPDNKFFEGFFDRNTVGQKWIPLDINRDIIEEWKLELPTGLMVKGYKEIIIDEDYSYQGEIWFIGELE
ncbi:DUF3916 domain-containing protein [Bacillus sp. RG28]|uniref:DUF3916 domain-containing protein n=1 Tax=Gottfriedia endophytica TaxID=2820819 RepID=A0A940NS09_9BACI|nr:DUF3916 domain-containing protein [Gottfriedia endophytica]MBP0723838.1 DUF3916 domain-containing protein [Gottfriedia endophytica]